MTAYVTCTGDCDACREYAAEIGAEYRYQTDEAVLRVLVEERSLQLAELQARVHELSGHPGQFNVGYAYPYRCTCGWRGRVFPEDQVRRG